MNAAFVMLVIMVAIALILTGTLLSNFDGLNSDYEIRKSLKQLCKRFKGQMKMPTSGFPEVLIVSDGTPYRVSIRKSKSGSSKYVCRVATRWDDSGFRLKIVRETFATATQDMLKALDAKVGNSAFDKKFYLRTNDADKMRQVLTCLLYTSPSPRDQRGSRMPSSA